MRGAARPRMAPMPAVHAPSEWISKGRSVAGKRITGSFGRASLTELKESAAAVDQEKIASFLSKALSGAALTEN